MTKAKALQRFFTHCHTPHDLQCHLHSHHYSHPERSLFCVNRSCLDKRRWPSQGLETWPPFVWRGRIKEKRKKGCYWKGRGQALNHPGGLREGLTDSLLHPWSYQVTSSLKMTKLLYPILCACSSSKTRHGVSIVVTPQPDLLCGFNSVTLSAFCFI